MNTFCSYYNQGICRSCTKIEIPYYLQIQTKEERLSQLLDSMGTFAKLPTVTSAEAEFRNKAKFSITGTIENPIIGLTGKEELDQGREIMDCPVHRPEINSLIKKLPHFIQLAKLKPYQIKLKQGELKGAILYYSSESQELYLRLIMRSKESLDRIKKHTQSLMDEVPGLKCVSVNIQPIPHAILEGEEEIFMSEEHYIKHQILDKQMSLHPQGFVQTNQHVATKLYSTAAEWVKKIAPQTFMELFSGQGAFSFFAQKYVSQAIGVEINLEAVERANKTAKEMKWNHLKFINADAATVGDEMMKFSPDVLLVNPPRRGLGTVTNLIRRSLPEYFIYSSCNAESLALDIKNLSDVYSIVQTQVFDMFPHTDHFETLVLLKRI